MKRAFIKIAISFVAASLFSRVYWLFAWHYFSMPYPDVIAPTFNMWAGAHYDAVAIEWFIEFFLIALAVVFASDWILRQPKKYPPLNLVGPITT